MDPLSDVLSLLKPQSYASGGFALSAQAAIRFPRHQGIKCYAVTSGPVWLVVETLPQPILLTAGDCFLLPRGLPFVLTAHPGLPPVDYLTLLAEYKAAAPSTPDPSAPYLVGGHFLLTGSHADFLLQALPAVVHIRKESDKAAMRWSLERMKEELGDPRPGGSLIAQQLACMMLVQALRLHLADAGPAGVGWLFALADPQMRAAITAVHEAPGQNWTLETLAQRAGMSRTVFAARFKQKVGATPLEYLTRWRMLLAGDRLQRSAEPIAVIAQSLGYESESAFGKAFRRVMQCSPRQYGRGGAAAQSAAG